MPDQFAMDAMFDELDAARAPAPSRMEPCDTPGCEYEAWVGEDDEHPWLCGYCWAEKRKQE
jgi:hypothetical protein